MALIAEVQDISTGNGKSIGELVDYLESEIKETVNYYGKEKSLVASTWGGGGAKHLGLNGAVEMEILQRVLEGKHPTDPNIQMRKQSANGTDTNLCGFDMTFSCSKELSIAILTADEKQRTELLAIDAEAVKFSMEWLEKNIQARTGAQGKDLQPIVGLVYAEYLHLTARSTPDETNPHQHIMIANVDPHVHRHVAIANVGMWIENKKDGSEIVHYNSLDTAQFAKLRMEASSIYSMKQAEGLQKAGYNLERFGAEDKFLRLTGIDPLAVAIKSSRHKEIVNESSDKNISLEQAQKTTRGEKVVFNSLQEVQEATLNGLDKYGINEKSIQSLKTDKVSVIDFKDRIGNKLSDAVVAKNVLEKLVDKNALFTQTQMRTHFNIAYSGSGKSYEEIQTISKDAEKQMVFVKEEKGQRFYALKSTLATEYQFLNSIEKSSKIGGEWKLSKMDMEKSIFELEQKKGFSLTVEQKNALVKSTNSDSSFSIWIGKAGAGKTTAAEVLNNAYTSKGFQVLGATPSSKAMDGLIDAGIKTSTNDQLIIDIESGRTVLNSKTVILLDECGMVGVQNLNKIKQYADRAGAKIIAVGDYNQLDAVSWGSAFLEASKIVGEDVSTLAEVRRQKNDRALEVAQLFSNENIDAEQVKKSIKMMIENEMIKTSIDNNTAKTNLVNDILEQKEEWKEKPVLCGTNRDCDDINTRIQERLKNDNTIMTEAIMVKKNGVEKVRQFSAGDRFIFLEKATEKKCLAGSSTANNNDLGTIKSIEKKGKGYIFEVELDKGGIVKFNTNAKKDAIQSFDLGYSMTIHKSQGITAKVASVFLNGNEDKSKLYVALSRHQHGVKMYLDEKNMSVLNEVQEIQHKRFIYHHFKDKDAFFQSVEKLDVEAIKDFISINPDSVKFKDENGKNAIDKMIAMSVPGIDKEAFKEVFKALSEAGCDKTKANAVIMPPPHILHGMEHFRDTPHFLDTEHFKQVADVVADVVADEVKEIKVEAPKPEKLVLTEIGRQAVNRMLSNQHREIDTSTHAQQRDDEFKEKQEAEKAQSKALEMQDAEEMRLDRFYDAVEKLKEGNQNISDEDIGKQLKKDGFKTEDVPKDYQEYFDSIKIDSGGMGGSGGVAGSAVQEGIKYSYCK